MQHPYTKPSQRPSSSSEQATPSTTEAAPSGLNITLSPLRQSSTSPAPVTLDVQGRTSIYDLKTQLAAKTGYAPDKLKILWERKPVSDSKTLKEATGASDGSLKMSVMYVGSPTNAPGAESSPAPATAGSKDDRDGQGTAENMDVDQPTAWQGPTGRALMESTDFWNDLRGFLVQRVRDEAVADEAIKLWRQQWTAK